MNNNQPNKSSVFKVISSKVIGVSVKKISTKLWRQNYKDDEYDLIEYIFTENIDGEIITNADLKNGVTSVTCNGVCVEKFAISISYRLNKARAPKSITIHSGKKYSFDFFKTNEVFGLMKNLGGYIISFCCNYSRTHR